MGAEERSSRLGWHHGHGGRAELHRQSGRWVHAINDETGEVFWEFLTGAGIVGQPVTYEIDGAQYAAIVAGWGGGAPLWGGEVGERAKFMNQGGSVWVFMLAK
jgi:alcohol dehydrogenase (cytochrome c)